MAPRICLPLMKKVGRGLDVELLRRPRADRFDALEHLLILEALVEALLGKARLLGDRQQRLQRPLHHPVPLLGEQRFDHREIFRGIGGRRLGGILGFRSAPA